MIRYDRSSWSVVAYCTCGWRELTVTQEGAWAAARGHEVSQHPDRYQVRDAEEQRRRDRIRRTNLPPGPLESWGTGGTIGG